MPIFYPHPSSLAFISSSLYLLCCLLCVSPTPLSHPSPSEFIWTLSPWSTPFYPNLSASFQIPFFPHPSLKPLYYPHSDLAQLSLHVPGKLPILNQSHCSLSLLLQQAYFELLRTILKPWSMKPLQIPLLHTHQNPTSAHTYVLSTAFPFLRNCGRHLFVDFPASTPLSPPPGIQTFLWGSSLSPFPMIPFGWAWPHFSF